ncbi:MAG: hypothetical protein JW720_11505 [Sedimentisphaerales bacterium]|nr:hypothetical protein [Sedimentisphaerales bacterium]
MPVCIENTGLRETRGSAMDTSRQFKPQTILLWEKVVEHAEAQRIVRLFPSAEVRIIKQQRYHPSAGKASSRALLDGKRILMVGHSSSFVGHFDGRLGPDVSCRPYYKLVPVSNGCPFYCTYCYLAFVYRKHAPFMKININYETMFRQIRRAAAVSCGTVSFNMGEMLDSLALDHVTNLTTRLVPFFSEFPNAYLMLLTKSNNIANLLQLKPNRQTVVSWSVNTQQMIDTHEIGAASLSQRIQAAKACQEHGYRIRLRIDPGMLHKNWRASYADLIRQVMTTVRPDNITLGMLRLLPGHLRLAKEAYGDRADKLHDSDLVERASDGKLRYPTSKRIEFYTFLADAIRSFDVNVSIGLCRETPNIRKNLKQLCSRRQCNCVMR